VNANEAAAALADVGRTEERLAQRARWPFRRHAMFGLAEGLMVAAVAQPVGIAGGMMAGGLALLAMCIAEDRRRHGMFVSGWQAGATRPLTMVLGVFLVGMLAASLAVRDGVSAQPLGYLIGVIVLVVCTAASLRWERIHRAALGREAGQ
jgi:MFS family permease